MKWCERQQSEVYYCLGLAKNSVLIEKLAPALADARARRCLSGAASVRVFSEFEYRTPRRTVWLLLTGHSTCSEAAILFRAMTMQIRVKSGFYISVRFLVPMAEGAFSLVTAAAVRTVIAPLAHIEPNWLSVYGPPSSPLLGLM